MIQILGKTTIIVDLKFMYSNLIKNKMVSKIKEIIQSYIIQLNPTELQKEIAEERLSVCMGNEEKKNTQM